MEVKGSVQEIKELFKNFQLKEDKKTPVAGTTDVNKYISAINMIRRANGQEQIARISELENSK